MVNNQTTHARNASARLVPIGLLLLLGGMVTAACGVDDVSTKNNPKTGGTGGAGATGNTGNVGNTSGAGEDPVGGQGPGPCKEGKKQCNGNTPQTCNADGVWEDGEECGGTTKVCTGAGICAAYRLVNAGIDSFGVRPAEPVDGTKLILKEQTLSAAPRACNKAGLCVTGGIR